MELTEKEKTLRGLFNKLGGRSKEDLLMQAEAMVRAQDALKADYGLSQPVENIDKKTA